VRPRPLPPARTIAILLFAALAPLSGCGVPPHLAPPEGPLPRPTSPGSLTTPTPATPTAPAATNTPADTSVVVDCAGEPDSDEVLAVLRDDGLLADTTATVVEGPLCAAGWQLTVVSVADRDPLQVVTSGQPGDLTLVTAGTDVCTIEVRVHAPPGIRRVAGCVG
jgi:hypothetical protein